MIEKDEDKPMLLQPVINRRRDTDDTRVIGLFLRTVKIVSAKNQKTYQVLLYPDGTESEVEGEIGRDKDLTLIEDESELSEYGSESNWSESIFDSYDNRRNDDGHTQHHRYIKRDDCRHFMSVVYGILNIIKRSN